MNNFKIDSNYILSFILSVFVFVLLIDPTNTIFNIKDLLFIILVVLSVLHYSTFKINGLILIFSTYIIVLMTFFFGLFIYKFDFGFTLSIIKGFSPLLLLLWIDKYKILEKLLFPSLIICFILFFSFLAFFYDKTLFEKIYNFSAEHDFTIIIASRSILGNQIMMFFYKSLPILFFPAAIYANRFFNSRVGRFKNFLVMSVLLLSLMLGGTRACMLASIILIAINIFMWLLRSNIGRVFLVPLFAGFVISFGILFFSLILEKDEISNKVKYDHLESYSELVSNHPSIILFGQGAGSLFYSKGLKKLIVQTEWTYLEFIRMFGLIGGTIIILIFIYPLYLLYKKRKLLDEWKPVFIGYLLYLFVAGTNPLLVSSTGMLALLVAYSYSLNNQYVTREVSII